MKDEIDRIGCVLAMLLLLFLCLGLCGIMPLD